MLTFENIEAAAKLLNGIASHTAMVSADPLDLWARQVFIKSENLQKTGSFKLRARIIK